MLLLGGSACKDDGNRQYRHHLRSPPRARKGKSPVLGRGLCLSGHNQRGTRPDLRNKPRACGATMTGRRPLCVDHVRDLRCCVGAGEPRVAELTLFCLEGCGLPAFDPRATSSAPPLADISRSAFRTVKYLVLLGQALDIGPRSSHASARAFCRVASGSGRINQLTATH